MGVWTVSATGYNSESSSIVSGSKTFSFNNANSTVYIGLNSQSGTGSLQADIKWEKTISDPRLEIIIEHDGTTEKEEYAPGSNSSSYKYIKNNLQAGSYTLIANIYNSDNHVTGLAEAVQIINNRTTSGTVELMGPEKASSKSTTLYLTETSGRSLAAHLTASGFKSLPSTLEAGKEQVINLVLDSTLINSNTYQVYWYLDGTLAKKDKELTNSNNLTITPSVGDHILCLIINDAHSETCASMYYRFTAKTNASEGSAAYVSTLSQSQSKIVLASDSLIGALPNNHFLIVTPSRSSMQVVSIYNNAILLSANQTYNATDLRFPWLSQVSAIYSNPNMNFFALITGTNCIHIVRFDLSTEKIDIAIWNEEPLVLSDFVTMPPCFLDNISSIALIPTSGYAGTFFVMDSGPRSEEILRITTSDSEVTKLGTSPKKVSTDKPTCAKGFNNLLAYTTSDGSINIAKLQSESLSSEWSSHTDTQLQNTKDFFFLNQQFVVFETATKLIIYEYYSQQKMWVQVKSIDAKSTALTTSQNGAYIYFTDNELNLFSYKSGLSDNFGKIFTQKLTSNLVKLVSNNSHIVGLDASGNLYIFEIVQEDSSL